MNSPDALYFPTTALWSLRQYPFFLLLPKIHILSPFEDDGKGPQKDTNSFINSGLCQEHTPCPLGEDRARFLRLVADIKARTDDYAAQLSALTIAGYTAPKSAGESSEREIINSMFIPGDLAAREKDASQQELLWRTRLILAVSDLLDQEQEEIAFHMQALANDEKDLFQELQGEDDDISDEEELFAILANLNGKVSQPNPNQAKNRLNAWKILFSKTTTLPDDVILLTDRDSGDLLLESYEKMTTENGILLGTIDLPALLGPDDSSALATVSDFRQQNHQTCTDLQKMLAVLQTLQQAAMVTAASQREQFESIAAELTKAINEAFPEQKYGRRTLSFHVCPRLSVRNHLLATSRQPRQDVAEQAMAEQTNAILLIAE